MPIPSFLRSPATFIASTSLLVIGLMITACGGDRETSNEQRGEQRMNPADYPEVPAPTETPTFRWDFSDPQKAFLYDYQQDVEMLTQTGATHTDEVKIQEQFMTAKGRLQIVPRRNRTADLLLQNVRAEMRIGSATAEPQTQTMAAVEISGLREDGSGGSGDGAQETFLRMLFPLPPHNLEVGESVEVPMEMPYQLGDQTFPVRGSSRITLAAYVMIGDRLCARIEVASDISKLEIPASIEGSHGLSAKGTSVFFFDVNERAFVEGTTDLEVQLLTEDARHQVAMESVNRISVRRR